jgi:hypothetical protein
MLACSQPIPKAFHCLNFEKPFFAVEVLLLIRQQTGQSRPRFQVVMPRPRHVQTSMKWCQKMRRGGDEIKMATNLRDASKPLQRKVRSKCRETGRWRRGDRYKNQCNQHEK